MVDLEEKAWAQGRRQNKENSALADRAAVGLTLLALVYDPKVVNPLTRLYLRDQPAGLLAAARPSFGGSIRVSVFRRNRRIRSSYGYWSLQYRKPLF
jgi:hypothetical protein